MKRHYAIVYTTASEGVNEVSDDCSWEWSSTGWDIEKIALEKFNTWAKGSEQGKNEIFLMNLLVTNFDPVKQAFSNYVLKTYKRKAMKGIVYNSYGESAPPAPKKSILGSLKPNTYFQPVQLPSFHPNPYGVSPAELEQTLAEEEPEEYPSEPEEHYEDEEVDH